MTSPSQRRKSSSTQHTLSASSTPPDRPSSTSTAAQLASPLSPSSAPSSEDTTAASDRVVVMCGFAMPTEGEALRGDTMKAFWSGLVLGHRCTNCLCDFHCEPPDDLEQQLQQQHLGTKDHDPVDELTVYVRRDTFWHAYQATCPYCLFSHAMLATAKTEVLFHNTVRKQLDIVEAPTYGYNQRRALFDSLTTLCSPLIYPVAADDQLLRQLKQLKISPPSPAAPVKLSPSKKKFQDLKRGLEHLFHLLNKQHPPLVPCAAFHDTLAQADIETAGHLRPCHADDKSYDGFLADAASPDVVFLCVTQKEWPPKSDQWALPRWALYPRDTPSGIDISRVRVDLATHLPLHTNRYSLYFVMCKIPPRGKTIQLHIAVVDNHAEDALKQREYFTRLAVPLPKFRNRLFFYRQGQWWHPQQLTLPTEDCEGYSEAKDVWLNLCVTSPVDVTGAEWSTVRKYSQ